MKKKLISIMLMLAMTVSMVACGGADSKENDNEQETVETTNPDKPETTEIKWAQGLSGNILVTIAKEQGYFDEVGLSVEEIPLDPGGLNGVIQESVDIASNFGTSTPLQMIAAGDDMAIIGGFMMEGAMAIVGPEGAEWNGIESFKGKRVAGNQANYATAFGLSEAGVDPVKDVEWIQFENEGDGVSAILNGEVDYAVIGTGWMYQTKNTEGIEILSWTDEVTPEYSCCRMVARKSWVEENPTTVKLLIEALLRAQLYFEAHREECIQLMADFLQADYDYVEAYMGEEEHYEINVDPLYNTDLDQWQFLKDYEYIDQDVDDNIIKDAIYTDIYKSALDYCVENYYDDNPNFWDSQVELFERQTN